MTRYFAYSPTTAQHYKNKIAVYINWWMKRGYPDGIPDEADLKIENAGKAPSWRRICKTLLRNDYWCKYLGFSPTKTRRISGVSGFDGKTPKELEYFC